MLEMKVNSIPSEAVLSMWSKQRKVRRKMCKQARYVWDGPLLWIDTEVDEEREHRELCLCLDTTLYALLTQEDSSDEVTWDRRLTCASYTCRFEEEHMYQREWPGSQNPEHSWHCGPRKKLCFYICHGDYRKLPPKQERYKVQRVSSLENISKASYYVKLRFLKFANFETSVATIVN